MMAQCVSQIRIRKGEEFIDVPCGRCNFCLQNRRKEWSFRLQKELRHHTSAFFLTLTYDDGSLPFVEVDQVGTFASLCKEDFQLFMKRLRKAQAKQFPDKKIKYYAVGEYGTQYLRPHYHAIVFSLDRKLLPQLPAIWKLGFVKVGTVTNDSIDYVTKYVINKQDFKHLPVKPFALISNGIGIDHFIQNENRYKNESVVIGGRGYPQRLPRYYREKLDRNPYTEAIANQKQQEKHLQAERDEFERLRRLGHTDPDAYAYERKMASHNRIGKNSKKGGVF